MSLQYEWQPDNFLHSHTWFQSRINRCARLYRGRNPRRQGPFPTNCNFFTHAVLTSKRWANVWCRPRRNDDLKKEKKVVNFFAEEKCIPEKILAPLSIDGWPWFIIIRGISAIRPLNNGYIAYFSLRCAIRSYEYFYFRSKIWRHQRVPRPWFPERSENFDDSRTFKAYWYLHGFSGILGLKWGFSRAKWWKGWCDVDPKLTRFYCWGSYICANFGKNRPWVCPQTDTLTDANRFYYRAAWNADAAILSVRPSVCLSVCLSVKRVNCDKTEERSVQIFIPYERSFKSSEKKNAWWGRPLLSEILGQPVPVGAKSPILNRHSLVSPQP